MNENCKLYSEEEPVLAYSLLTCAPSPWYIVEPLSANTGSWSELRRPPFHRLPAISWAPTIGMYNVTKNFSCSLGLSRPNLRLSITVSTNIANSLQGMLPAGTSSSMSPPAMFGADVNLELQEMATIAESGNGDIVMGGLDATFPEFSDTTFNFNLPVVDSSENRGAKLSASLP